MLQELNRELVVHEDLHDAAVLQPDQKPLAARWATHDLRTTTFRALTGEPTDGQTPSRP